MGLLKKAMAGVCRMRFGNRWSLSCRRGNPIRSVVTIPG